MDSIYDLAGDSWIIETWAYTICDDYDFTFKVPKTGKHCFKRHGKRCYCWSGLKHPVHPTYYGCQSGGKLDRVFDPTPATIKDVLERRAVHRNPKRQTRIKP